MGASIRARFRALEAAKLRYDAHMGDAEIEAIQLRRFNEVWQAALDRCEFYKGWQQQHDLPSQISSVQELDAWPVLTKQQVRDNQQLVFGDIPQRSAYVTGGTTSEPARFPSTTSEHVGRYASNHVGRSWWGISPLEKSALTWAHSHLYGTGWRRAQKIAIRRAGDLVSRTVRLDGDRVSKKVARAHARRILEARPTNIVGYPSAMARIARNLDPGLASRFAKLQLKGVIVTAETLRPQDEELLRSTFSCPVIVEYGAIETGVIAVSRGTTRNIEVLWHDHLVRQADGEVHITTLVDRAFPLINYALSDSIEPTRVSPGGSVLALSRISGRVHEVLRAASTRGPVEITAVQLSDILGVHEGVHASQYAQEAPGRIGVYVRLAPGTSLATVEKFFWGVVRPLYPELAPDAVEFFDEPDQLSGRSGKHLVIRPPAVRV